MRVAVLALQGGFAPHIAMLGALGHLAIEARSAGDVSRADGLLLPGGESTAIRHLLARDGGALERAIRAHHAAGRPILATCAGLILLAREVRDPPARSLGLLDLAVARNGWGRQRASEIARDDAEERDLVLIRAPRIVGWGPGVEILARYRGEPVLVREGAIVGATFHPELAADTSLHALAFGRSSDPPERAMSSTANTGR
jgi:5'-phosphate synthase pdxT subunit